MSTEPGEQADVKTLYLPLEEMKLHCDGTFALTSTKGSVQPDGPLCLQRLTRMPEFCFTLLCIYPVGKSTMTKHWKITQVSPFCGCCAADSWASAGIHQLYNN